MSLPPRLSGTAKASLEVRIDILKTLHDSTSQEKPKFVKLQWWGQNVNEVKKHPVSVGTEIKYQVVTKSDQFVSYLQDAGRLYIEALDSAEETMGFAVVERLERIVNFGGITADDVEVFDQNGQVIALLRCIFMFEEFIEEDRGKKVTFDDPDYDEVYDEDEDTLKEVIKKSEKRLLNIKPTTKPAKVMKEIPSKTAKETPSWNLSTDRIKFLSRVTSFTVKIRQVTLNAGVVPHVSTFNVPKATRNRPSFFIKYSLPNESQEIAFCASKQAKPKIQVDNILTFHGQADHPIRFTTQILDSWWITSINLNLYARHLNQRLPLHIGNVNLALKYLLINSKYSSGSEMKLPIYSATSFRKHLDSHFKEEIIGDIHLTFQFDAPEPEGLKAKATKKVELESKPTIDNHTKIEMEAAKNDLVLCLLRVDQGRNFSLDTNSLYITCRFFSDAKHVSSSVAWNSNTKPKFELQHVVPLELEKSNFLENVCKDNNLVLEIWNFSEPASSLVGIATISLHQLYTAFNDDDTAKKHLSSDLPLIAVNDWISVRGLLDGQIVGEIKVLFAAGLGTQLYKLSLLQEDDKEPTEEATEMESIDLMSEDQVPEGWLWFSVTLNQARNLPLISARNQREPPKTYVSISNGLKTFTSQTASKSCHPQWAFQTDMPLSEQLLVDPKRQLIVKVWHKDSNMSDYVIGFAAVDLGILLHNGFKEVCGWYNVMDFVGRCRGQVKVEIRPHLDVSVLRQRFGDSKEDNGIQKTQPWTKNIEETRKETYWQPPSLPEIEGDKSLLDRRLHELDTLSKQLKSKLDFENDSISEVHEDDDDRATLDRLRANLASQFEAMQSALIKLDNPEDDLRPRMAPDGGNPHESDKS